MMNKLIEIYRKLTQSEASRFAQIERQMKAELQKQFPGAEVI